MSIRTPPGSRFAAVFFMNEYIGSHGLVEPTRLYEATRNHLDKRGSRYDKDELFAQVNMRLDKIRRLDKEISDGL